MKFYQFIKAALLVLLLSSSLMLGQAGRIKETRINKCFDEVAVKQTEKSQVIELRVLQTSPVLRLTIAGDCTSLDATYLGAFFQFSAF